MRRRLVVPIASALLAAGLAAPADAGAVAKVALACLPASLVTDRLSRYSYAANGTSDVGLAIVLSGSSSVRVTGLQLVIDDTGYFWSTNNYGYWLGVFNADGTVASGASTDTGAFSFALGGKLKPYLVQGDMTDVDPLSGRTARLTVSWSNRSTTGSSEATCVVP
jgi:hypothetical protein